MLTDFAIISILIVIAQLVRSWVPWARRWMIPSSMIAGGLGLIFGPQAFNVLPFTRVVDTHGVSQLQIAQYPAILIVFVFATLLMGHNSNRGQRWNVSQGVRVSLLYNLAAELGQYGLAALFGLTVLAVIYPALPSQFATMLASGFAGGHGTASIFGQAFKSQGWEDALSVGFAFATIGLLSAIFGGVLLINIGARCGWTRFVRSNSQLNGEESQAFVPKAEQSSIGAITANPIALDPLAWHLALLGTVYGLTLVADLAIHWVVPGDYWVPLFAIGMLIGALLQFTFELIGVGQFIDRSTMRRFGSLAADFLVAFGIAAIKIDVVWQYAGPILIMSVFGILYSVTVLLLGSWIFSEYWFEQSIFTYGWLTGVVGFSVALLRIVDPQLKSKTLEDYGAAYILIGPVELLLYPAIIWACASGRYLAVGVTLTSAACFLFLAARLAAKGSTSVRIDAAIPAESIQSHTIC